MDLKKENVFQPCVKCAWGKGEMGSWKSASSGVKSGGSSGQPRMSLVAEEVEIPVLALSQRSETPAFPIFLPKFSFTCSNMKPHPDLSPYYS